MEEKVDLFDSPAAIDALAEFEGEVSSADHERVVVTDGQDEQGVH